MGKKYLDLQGTRYLLEEIRKIIEEVGTGEVDLTDYVTKAELQEKLDALEIDVDLSSYATKEELEDAVKNIDLTTYATKDYVTNAINSAQLGGADGSSIDLSIYALKSEVNTALEDKADAEHTHDGYAQSTHTHKIADITDYSAPDLSTYAKKTEIPSLAGYATTTYVDEAVANVSGGGTGGSVDLTNYYTKDETYSKIEVNEIVDGIGDAYTAYLNSKEYRWPQYGDILEEEDTLTDVTGNKLSGYLRCDYSDLCDYLNDNIDVLDTRIAGNSISAPYIDVAYCTNQTPTECVYNYEKQAGDYWYRFCKQSRYIPELLGTFDIWTLYFVYYNSALEEVPIELTDFRVYDMFSGTAYPAIKVLTGDAARPVACRLHPLYYIAALSGDAEEEFIKNVYTLFKVFVKVIPISREDWLESLKGETLISFADLTDEQKAELKGEKGETGEQGEAFTYEDFTEEQLAALKGEKGDKGDTGDKGDKGDTGADGYTPVKGTDYWTDEDIATIKAYIDTGLGEVENGSY